MGGYVLHGLFAGSLLALALWLHETRLSAAGAAMVLVTFASVGLLYVLCVGRWGVTWGCIED